MSSCPHCRQTLDESRPQAGVCPACGQPIGSSMPSERSRPDGPSDPAATTVVAKTITEGSDEEPAASVDLVARTIQAGRWVPSKGEWEDLAATASPELIRTLMSTGFLAAAKTVVEKELGRTLDSVTGSDTSGESGFRDSQPPATSQADSRGNDDPGATLDGASGTVPDWLVKVESSSPAEAQSDADLGATVDSGLLTETGDGSRDGDLGVTVDSADLPASDGAATVDLSDGTVRDVDATIDSSAFGASGSGGGINVGPAKTAGRSDVTFDGSSPGPGYGSDGSGFGSRSLEDTLVIQPRRLGGEGGSGAPPGERADYNLDKKLGEGGMGVVYAAWQQSIRRVVALKMLKRGSTHQTAQREKFLAEAVITGELEHPNIVPIYDLGRDVEGAIFYAMKRVQGTPWDKLIRKQSLPENLEILMKVADAVGFAHSKRVIHRDLKPENVMLGDFGEVLVMDWGLAVTLGESSAIAMAGTPAYMAPEMVMGPPSAIGLRSDIYLLGAILYEIVTGHRPHGGSSITQCLMAAGQNEIKPTEKTGELVDIALRAMATRPKDRFGSVREFQDAIRDYQSHTESISLSARAEEDLAEAIRSDRYETYARAMFGFQEATSLWGGNEKAKRGALVAALEYARGAQRRGDYELGLSLLDDSIPPHRALAAELREAQQEVEQRKQRLQAARRLGTTLIATIFVVVTGAFFWIRAKEQQARIAQNEARVAEGEAREAQRIAQEALTEAIVQRKAAETARESEETQRMLAEDAKMAADGARKIAEQQREEADRARGAEFVQRQAAERARASEQYEGYIAKIGLAAAKIEENAFDRALDLVEECPVELRNWEWGRLKYLCTRELRSFELGGPLETISLSPDGRRFASGGWGGNVSVSSVDGDGEPLSLQTSATHVFAVAFSPDGRRLAVGSNDQDGYLTIWDLETGVPAVRLVGHRDAVLSLAWSADGSRLLSGSYDQSARLWDVAAGTSRELLGHDGWVWAVRFSPDETQILTAGQDGSAILWDAESLQPGPPFLGQQGSILAAAFAPDGSTIATGGQDGRVLLWQPEAVRGQDLRLLVDAGKDEAARGITRVLQAHGDAVRSIQFSRDGKSLLTAGNDNVVRIWDRETEEAIKQFRGHGSRVAAAIFNLDETEVLSASYDERVKLWSVDQHEELRVVGGQTLDGHRDSVLAAAFDPSGNVIVSAGRDRSAIAWDRRTGKPLRSFTEGHAYLASTALFLPNGKRVVTAAIDNTARIWDRDTGTQIQTLPATGISAAIDISANAGRIATGSDRKSVLLWDFDGQPIGELGGFVSDVTALAFSPDGQRILTGDSVGRCRMIDSGTGSIIWESRTHSRSVTGVAFVAGGDRVLTASADHVVSVRAAESGEEDPARVLKHPAQVTAMTVSQDGRRVLTACADKAVRWWDLATGKILLRLDGEAAPTGIDLSPDGRLVAIVSADRRLRLWDLESQTELPSPRDGTLPFLDLSLGSVPIWTATFADDSQRLITVGGSEARLWDLATGRDQVVYSPQSAVSSVSFSPTGDRFVTGSWDRSARVWDLAGGRAVLKVGEGVHSRFVNAAAFSPDGTRLATAGDDRVVRIWDTDSGEAIGELKGHEGPIHAVDFSPDGLQLLTASADQTAQIWELEDFQPVHRLAGHTQSVLAARYSPDGQFVLTGSDDTTARLWDAETGDELPIRLEGHTAGVAAVAFTPDGSRVVTGGKDMVAKLWDPETGKEILTLSGHTQELTSVDVSSDSRYLLTGSRDGKLILWPSAPWKPQSAEQAETVDLPALPEQPALAGAGAAPEAAD
ncbi:MAG: serine/threonine protein kinase [Planctomycetaceae bacterium]|nr:MAG: serine/threonine protein kinase [Planctomycetaceae bacterium]